MITFSPHFCVSLVLTLSPPSNPAASRDDFLGECTVDLAAVGASAELELALHGRAGRADEGYVTGTVTVGVEVAAAGSAATVDKETVLRMKDRLQECLQTQARALDLSGLALPGLPRVVGERFGHVQRLDLALNKLAVLPDLARLTALEELDLTGNVLAALPAAVGRLACLEKLELNTNMLGALPPELGRLSCLEELCVSGNPLGALPPALGALRNLATLDASVCRLRALPEELTLATRLIDLNVSGNQLERLPDGIGRMTRLVTLNVQDNRLTDLPVTIGLCHSLGQPGYGINLARNPIADPEMLAQYAQGADALFDYLARRYAMNNNPRVPYCPLPTDLGEGPLPAWLVQEQERMRRVLEIQNRNAAASAGATATGGGAVTTTGTAAATATGAGATATTPASQHAPASGEEMERKVVALRSWAQITVKEVLLPAFAGARERVRGAAELRELLAIAYRLAHLNDEFARVRTLAPVSVRGPGALPALTPLIDQVRVYTLAALNYVDAGVRAVLAALEAASAQQIAAVVQLVQVLNKVKTAFQP